MTSNNRQCFIPNCTGGELTRIVSKSAYACPSHLAGYIMLHRHEVTSMDLMEGHPNLEFLTTMVSMYIDGNPTINLPVKHHDFTCSNCGKPAQCEVGMKDTWLGKYCWECTEWVESMIGTIPGKPIPEGSGEESQPEER